MLFLKESNMTTVAIVYHSGYGHTAVVADSVAEGVRAAGAEPLLLRIDNAAQDFTGLLEAAAGADAIVFGAPTYMGDVSAAFRAFAEASSKVFAVQGWKDKLAGGFTNSQSFNGEKANALNSLVVLAAQHGMIWTPPALPPGSATGRTGPDDVNRLGSSLGVMTQSDNASPEVTPPAGDRETARLYGRRIAQAAQRWRRGALSDALAA